MMLAMISTLKFTQAGLPEKDIQRIKLSNVIITSEVTTMEPPNKGDPKS